MKQFVIGILVLGTLVGQMVLPGPAMAGRVGGTVTGTIVAAETNRPLAGAIMELQRRSGRGARPVMRGASDALGVVTLTVPAGTYGYQVRLPGYGVHQGTVAVAAGAKVAVPLPLNREARIVGRIVDSAGRPVPDLTVITGSTATSRTDRGGRFTLAELDAGWYELSLDHPQWVPERQNSFTLAAGERKDTGDVVVRRAGSLVVRVLSDGRPVNGASLSLSSSLAYRYGTTDRFGLVRFAKLPPGSYSLECYDERLREMTTAVEIPEGREATLALKAHLRPPTLSLDDAGRVVLPGGVIPVSLRGLHVSRARLTVFAVDRNRLLDGTIDPTAGDTVPVAARTLVREESVALVSQRFTHYRRAALKLNPLPPGMYLVVAEGGGARTSSTFFVTRLGLVAKTAPSGVLLLAADLVDGSPLSDVTVRESTGVAGGASTAVSLGSTGSDGILVLPARRGSSRLMGSRGEHLAVLVRADRTEAAEDVAGYLYTERPAYRPGQTVYFKGVLRKRVGEGYALPGLSSVHVTVTDSSEQEVFKGEYPLSTSGAFTGELALAETPSLGEYAIKAEAGGQTFSGSFQVLEYRKPEFQVSARSEKRFLVAGDPATVSLSARYYFGAPVANATVKYRVYTSPYYAGDHDADGTPDSGGDDGEYSGYAEFVQEGDTTTDASGRALITVATRAGEDPLVYRLELDVADVAGRQVTAASSFVATPSLLNLTVRPLSYLTAPGHAAELQVHVRTWEGAPRGTTVRLAIAEQVYNRASRSYEYRTLETRDVTTGADGRVTLSQIFPRPGYWRITGTAHDERGLQAAGTGWVWVWREGFAWDSSYRELAVELDKKRYRPGDTARVIVRSPAAGAALLLTVEGRELYSRRLVPAAAAVQVVDVPVTEAMAPYVFVSVVQVHQGRFYSQTRTLQVDHRPDSLDVRITPDKERYSPGERVRLAVAAHGADGLPRRAEFSLAVVDEALFAVAPEQQPDIYRFFRGTREHLVLTLNSFPRVYLGGAAKAAAPAPADEQLRGIKVRKVFKDTAYWLPSLLTGADGVALAEFELPDNLTTWRSTAVGFTGQSEFGTGTERFVASLDVMARLQPPRFLTVGDQLAIPGVLTNMTDRTRPVTGVFSVDNLSVLGDVQVSGTVPAGGTLRRDLSVRADAPGEALVRIQALAGDRGDAMELSLPVHPRAIARVSEGNIVLRGQSGDAVVSLPEGALPEGAVLEVQVAPTLAASLAGSLEELIDFPYGCVEQTLSRFLPAVQVKRLHSSARFSLPLPVAEKLDRVLEEGLRRLYQFQNADGGWGWWQGSASDAAMTAHVMHGLAQTRAAGVPVRQEVLDRGGVALAGQLEKGALEDLPALYRAFAATGQGSEATERRIEAGWRQLVPSQRVQYLAALVAAGRTERAREVLRDLQGTVRKEGSQAWLQDDDALSWWYSWRWAGSAVETTALLLENQLALVPDDPLNAGLAEFLVRRRSGRWWNTTRGTAAVVAALSRYVGVTGELNASFTASLSLNGKERAQYEVSNGTLSRGAASLRIPLAELQRGDNRLVLARSGDSGALYLSARLNYQVPPEFAESRQGLSIQRTLYRLTPRQVAGTWRMEYVPLQPGTVLAPGDDVEVRLTIDAKDALNYVIIEDRLPAGFEVREARNDPRFAESSGFWDWYEHRERRDERMAFFREQLPAGRHEFRYVIYPELVGEMTALPAAIWPMYVPSLRAESGAWSLRVKQ